MTLLQEAHPIHVDTVLVSHGSSESRLVSSLCSGRTSSCKHSSVELRSGLRETRVSVYLYPVEQNRKHYHRVLKSGSSPSSSVTNCYCSSLQGGSRFGATEAFHLGMGEQRPCAERL